jgi:hypothetical protein
MVVASEDGKAAVDQHTGDSDADSCIYGLGRSRHVGMLLMV